MVGREVDNFVLVMFEQISDLAGLVWFNQCKNFVRLRGREHGHEVGRLRGRHVIDQFRRSRFGQR